MAIEKFTLARTEGVYECFPCLTQTAAGRLITVYRESDSHSAAEFSHLVLRHSDDGGHTWSERQVLAESRQQEGVLWKWNCPRIGQLSGGRLWVICDGYEAPPGERSTPRAVVHFWWSHDEGASWTGPEPSPITGIVPDKLQVTAAGTWLVAAQVLPPGGEFLVQRVFRSSDQGASWDGPIVICDHEGVNACEASVLQLPEDGLLVATMRENSGKGWPALRCYSADDGLTWEGPYATLLAGCHRPVSGFVADGRVMTTYRQTTAGKIGGGKNFLACLEDTASLREREPAQQGGIVLALDHDRYPQPDTGYSGWTVLPGDDLLVVNYIRDDSPLAQIRGYRLGLEEF